MLLRRRRRRAGASVRWRAAVRRGAAGMVARRCAGPAVWLRLRWMPRRRARRACRPWRALLRGAGRRGHTSGRHATGRHAAGHGRHAGVGGHASPAWGRGHTGLRSPRGAGHGPVGRVPGRRHCPRRHARHSAGRHPRSGRHARSWRHAGAGRHARRHAVSRHGRPVARRHVTRPGPGMVRGHAGHARVGRHVALGRHARRVVAAVPAGAPISLPAILSVSAIAVSAASGASPFPPALVLAIATAAWLVALPCLCRLLRGPRWRRRSRGRRGWPQALRRRLAAARRPRGSARAVGAGSVRGPAWRFALACSGGPGGWSSAWRGRPVWPEVARRQRAGLPCHSCFEALRRWWRAWRRRARGAGLGQGATGHRRRWDGHAGCWTPCWAAHSGNWWWVHHPRAASHGATDGGTWPRERHAARGGRLRGCANELGHLRGRSAGRRHRAERVRGRRGAATLAQSSHCHLGHSCCGCLFSGLVRRRGCWALALGCGGLHGGDAILSGWCLLGGCRSSGCPTCRRRSAPVFGRRSWLRSGFRLACS